MDSDEDEDNEEEINTVTNAIHYAKIDEISKILVDTANGYHSADQLMHISSKPPNSLWTLLTGKMDDRCNLKLPNSLWIFLVGKMDDRSNLMKTSIEL